MNHILTFNENMSDKSILDDIDDIAGYIDAETSYPISKWCTPDMKSKIANNSNVDKTGYIKYYIFSFRELKNLFNCEGDIIHRTDLLGLKLMIVVESNNRCNMVFFHKEDWSKLDIESIISYFNKSNSDVLFEDDIKIDKSEFDILYEDSEVIAVRPKSYRAAIRYSADANWKIAMKKNLDWIEKYLSKGSYYGGYNWYKSKKVTKEIDNWWSKVLSLPKKQSEVEVKEFIQDFPRYLLYIVIFKKLPIDDEYSKLLLLYDVSRSEYGEIPYPEPILSGGSGQMLDSTHNQVKVVNADGKRITFRDIHYNHGMIFSKPFHSIEQDFSNEKENMSDILGEWAEKGGEYRKDALVFIRSSKEPNRLQITRPSLMSRNRDNRVSWTRLGYYDDPSFNYWELDKETPGEKKVPDVKYTDYFQSISDNVKKLRDALDDNFGEL